MIKTVIGFALTLMLADVALWQGQALRAQQRPQTRYLIFWHPAEKVPELIERIGTRGDESHRLGFGMPTSTFELEDQLPDIIRIRFQTALEHDVAVMIHFDLHRFWQNRPDLWNWFDPDEEGYDAENRRNVEWFGWEGPPNKMGYLNWGEPQRIAPHICLTSPRVRAEITRLVSQVIAPILREELAALRQAGREDLFAGILVGSEPGIDDYSNVDPGTAKLMEEDGTPRRPLGFRALLDRGFSADNPPEDFHQALAEVNRDAIAFWCRQFVEAGISPSRLYTHVAAPAPPEMTHAPIWAAFNGYCRPGWTTYPVMKLATDFEPLYQALEQHGNPPWGGVEANAGVPGAIVDWESYLARHYNHGAALVAINIGATGEELPRRLEQSAFGEEALAAYRKFLAGETLQDTPTSPDHPQLRLQTKMRRVQEGIQRWQQEGGDLQPVGELVRQFETLMQAGNVQAAEATLDRVLETLGEAPNPDAKSETQPSPQTRSQLGTPRPVRLAPIPDSAETIFHLHVMDCNGGSVTQITFSGE